MKTKARRIAALARAILEAPDGPSKERVGFSIHSYYESGSDGESACIVGHAILLFGTEELKSGLKSGAVLDIKLVADMIGVDHDRFFGIAHDYYNDSRRKAAAALLSLI